MTRIRQFRTTLSKAEAERVLANAKRALRAARKKAADLAAAGGKDAAAGRRRGRLARAVNDLTELLEATRRIAAQTRQRITGVTPDGATRRVSLHDPDARPIAKGRLGKPVEFGHKAQICDNDDGIVLDHDVQRGDPADRPRLRPAVERVKKRTGRTPQTAAADRGYGEQAVEDALHDLGVKEVVIPRKGRPGKARQAHDRHHRRCPDLDRTRNPRPQPGQDQRPGRLTPPRDTPRPTARRGSRPHGSDQPSACDYFSSK
jgi:transposase, IS5 family